MAIIKLVVAVILTFGQFLSPYIAFVQMGGIDNLYDEWSPEQKYTADYAINLEKAPGKDFVVLNLADIQLSSKEVYGEYGKIAEATIAKAIEETKPDLITLTGDNAWCRPGYIRLVNYLDTFGIPWAAVMGNHDGDNGDKVYENWCAYLLYKAENSVFRFGPKDMGVGNYIINITENGKIIHTLYMVDTHTNTELPCGGYDHLWDNQLAWYEWAVKGTNELAGKTVESSVFFHIPCIQYKYAWEDAQYNTETGVYENPAYADSFGLNDETICCPNYDNGFFALAKELGSTKNMIAGHDHVNSSSILYDGIRLSYSLKCGPGCYWNDFQNGGSTLTIDSEGHAVFAHHYVDPATLFTTYSPC